jgi:hypothetical protein
MNYVYVVPHPVLQKYRAVSAWVLLCLTTLIA